MAALLVVDLVCINPKKMGKIGALADSVVAHFGCKLFFHYNAYAERIDTDSPSHSSGLTHYIIHIYGIGRILFVCAYCAAKDVSGSEDNCFW